MRALGLFFLPVSADPLHVSLMLRAREGGCSRFVKAGNYFRDFRNIVVLHLENRLSSGNKPPCEQYHS